MGQRGRGRGCCQPVRGVEFDITSLAQVLILQHCLGERLESDTPAQDRGHLREQVERADTREVAWVVAIQEWDVEGVGVEADKHICAFNNRPQPRQLFTSVRGVRTRLGVMDAYHRELLEGDVNMSADPTL